MAFAPTVDDNSDQIWTTLSVQQTENDLPRDSALVGSSLLFALGLQPSATLRIGLSLSPRPKDSLCAVSTQAWDCWARWSEEVCVVHDFRLQNTDSRSMIAGRSCYSSTLDNLLTHLSRSLTRPTVLCRACQATTAIIGVPRSANGTGVRLCIELLVDPRKVVFGKRAHTSAGRNIRNPK